MKAVKFVKFGTKKHKLLKALEETYGIVSDACKKVGCDRQTFYNYLKADELFKSEVEKINDASVDFVEGKLLQVIKGYKVEGGKVIPPDTTAIIFYLKCKGKNRGYVERTELEHLGSPIPVTINEIRLGENQDLPDADTRKV